MLKTDLQVKKWKPSNGTNRISCGNSLYLRGFNDGTKTFQFRVKGKWLNLGSYPTLSFEQARAMVPVCKRLLKDKLTTLDSLKGMISCVGTAHELDQIALDQGSSGQVISEMPTFDDAYRKWYNEQLAANTWTHRASISRPMTFYQNHAQAHIGNLRLDEITRSTIKDFLQPLFFSNPDLAEKLTGYIRNVFEDAIDVRLIEDNPCPTRFTRPKRETKHAASLEYQRLPELWQWLNHQPFSNTIKAAMRLAIITAHRASVVVHMRKAHYDRETGVWAIPAKPVASHDVGYMKSGRTFSISVPRGLRNDLELLIMANSESEFVFTLDGYRPINAESLRRNFRAFAPITTHGFRNTFKTWCLNNGIEQFLADRYVDHALQGLDKNYRRDDLFDQRALLADRYFSFCIGLEWFRREH